MLTYARTLMHQTVGHIETLNVNLFEHKHKLMLTYMLTVKEGLTRVPA